MEGATLSGGEAQPFKLAEEFAKRSTGQTLYILDLGPGNGVRGGEVVAEGTPEQVAEELRSFTGQYFKPMLECHKEAAE